MTAATTEWGPSLCAGTEFDSECDCGCASYDGNPSHECDWPDCGCGCKPLCAGCDAVQAHA